MTAILSRPRCVKHKLHYIPQRVALLIGRRWVNEAECACAVRWIGEKALLLSQIVGVYSEIAQISPQGREKDD